MANETFRPVERTRARGRRDSGDYGARKVSVRGEDVGPGVAVVGGFASLLELREWFAVHAVIQPDETILWPLQCPHHCHRDGIGDGLARGRWVEDMGSGRTRLAICLQEAVCCPRRGEAV